MSREIDERVVAMQFDNVKFEKNAKATIKTLDQLKKSLNLDKAVQGFDGLKKAAENLKLDEVGRKVTELSGKFKSMHGIMEKAFKVTMSPLHGLESAFKTLQGYVTKFIGFDMAGKIVHTFENALRSLTISPIQAGWNEYELKMDSIKTIMSGTGENLDVVKDKLQELNLYADKTIYSFSDMTSSIGKFTNNGVKLDVATAAIKGVANATADAGQDARSASMAMYNLSQALGLGKMTTLDWKSFENANIATIRLKDSFIQAGVASGQLVRKVTKDSKTGAETIKYYTKDSLKKGKSKWVEVTAENFRETLSEGWLDKQTMLSTFQIFSGDLKTIEDLRRLGFTEAAGFTDEDCERMLKIGQDAMTAATQVRTFTKMFDALKEAAQSGWAQSIEFIFGDMEEGTSLWTTLNEKIGGLLERSAKARNDALAEWRGLRKNENGEYVATHDVWGYDYEVDQYGDVRRVEGSWHKISSKLEDGREVLVNSFMELLDVIRDVGGAVGDAWSSVFGKLDSEKLWSITRGFQGLVKRVKEWLGSTTDANSRLSKITKGLKGVFGILKVVINFVKNGVQLTGKILKPFTDMAIDVFAKFGEFFEGIGNMNPGEALNKIGEGFTKLWNKITGLSWDSVKAKFSNAWGGIKETVRNWANENGLGGVWETMSGWKAQIVELFTNVKSWIQTAWQDVTDWIEDSGIASFFRDAWGWILKQFGIDDPAKRNPVEEMEESLLNTQKARGSSGMGQLLSGVNQAEEYGQGLTEMANSVDQAPIVTWIYKIKSAIEHAWEAVTTWPGWAEIASFFGDAWAWIGEQAGGAIDTVKSWFLPGSDENGNATDSPFIKLLNSIKSNIDTAWEAITGWPEWAKIGGFFGDAWAWIGEKAGGAIDTVKSWFLPGSDENGNATDSPFIKLLNSIKSSIDTAWEAITGWPEWNKIASFFGDAWAWIGEKAGGAIDTVKSWFLPGSEENGNATDSPFIQLLNSIKSRITTAWQRVSGWSGWAKIGEFFRDAWAWIGEQAGGAIDIVKSWFLPGSDENGNATDSPFIQLLNSIKSRITTAWQRVSGWSGWEKIGKFFGDAWTWIGEKAGGTIDIVKSWFLPGSDENGNATDSPFVKLLNSIMSHITTAWGRVSGWSGWKKIGKFFGDAWAWIGEKAGVVIDAVSSLFIPGTDENGNQTDPPIVALLRSIKVKVQEVWDDIVGWSGWAGIGLFLNNAKDWVLKLIGGDTMASAGSEKGVSEQVAQLVEGTVATAEVLDEAADTTVEAEKSADKMGILDTIFGKLGEYFDKVVGFVNQVASDTGLSSGLENVSKIFGIIHTVFSDIVDLLDVLFVKKDMGAFFTWLTENWTLVLAGISSIVLSFVGGNLRAKIANGANESEGVGSTVLKIALGVLAIAGAVMLLSDIDDDKLIKAVGAITVIGSVIAGVIVAANLTKQKTQQSAQGSQAWERIAGKLIGYAGIILILEEVLTKLPEFLEKTKGLGYTGDELIKTVTAVIEIVGGLALITTIVGKFSGGNFKAILYGSLGTMMAFGMFLATVLTMVDTLYTVIGISQKISGGEADKKVNDYIEKIRNFGKILSTIGEVFGGFIESFAYGFRKKNAEHNDELLKSDLEFMDEMAGEFTPQRISTLVRMASGLKDFIQAIPNSDVTAAATAFIGLVPQLGAALGQFGLSFKQAFDADASNETAIVGISTTQTIIEMFRQLVRSMIEMGELWDDPSEYLDGMDDAQKFEDLGYTYTQAAAALARGVQRGISENGLEGTKITFDATPIVDAIVVALGLGEDAIATAVHNMVQAGINANAEKQEYDASQVLAGVQGYLSFMTGDTTDKMSELISGGLGMAMGQASEGFGEQLFGSMDPEKLLGDAESKYGDVAKKIGEQMNFGNLGIQFSQFVPGEDGNTQLEGWIADLQSQLESGDYANGLEVSIHPVIELSELDGTMAQIREYFDQNPIMVNADTEVPNIIFNLENNTTIDSIREVNASVVQLINRVTEENAANMQTIDNMASRINNIATAIRNMGIYLDTGVLAGAVDQKLGYSAFLFGRTGISKY